MRMRCLSLRAGWLLALLVPVLAACVELRPGPAAPPAGTLRWSLEGVSDITRLDPARLSGNQENIPIYLIFGGLVRLNERLEVVGDGAERWSISRDGTVYTFHLRPNLKYGDGTPVVAEHVAAALARTLAPATGTDFALTFLENVIGARAVRAGTATSLEGVRALDERTLEIRLDSPRGYFLSQLTYALNYLVPPGKIEAAGDAWLDSAFGTGPFRVREHVAGQRLVLEGNPHYWAGPPGVELVEFRFFPNTNSAFDAYQAGEVDVMGSVQAGVPAPRLAETRNHPDFQTISTPVARYIGFNNTVPPFDNMYVRQAFAQAVDKDRLVAQVLGGSATPARRILPAGFAGTSEAIAPLAFDPVGARAALGLAGYVSGASLPPVTLTFESGDADLGRVAEALQRNWREILGIEVQLEPVPRQTLIDRLDAMIIDPRDPATRMQLYISVWGADYPDPQNFISLQLRSGSPYNNGHWQHARFDALVDEADRMSGQGQQRERFQRYRDAEQIAISEVGWLPLYNPLVTLAIRPTVRGLAPTVSPQGIIAADWTRVRIERDASRPSS
ncbi:MAG: peptide ABC transporter substrate-binding protein [Chloroflexi bacterium]|nr:peptide ABC transporter substrate-binding protein [Chloroflexota bacterium]